MLLSLKC